MAEKADASQVPTRWTAPWASRSVLLLHLTTSHIDFESTNRSLAPIGQVPVHTAWVLLLTSDAVGITLTRVFSAPTGSSVVWLSTSRA